MHPQPEELSTRAAWIIGSLVTGLLGGVFYFIFVYVPHHTFSEAAFAPQSLSGTISAKDSKLGTWSLTPERCLSGRALGFTGVAFYFASGSPLDEVRLDNQHDGDNIVGLRFADDKAPPVRIHEKDCVSITGSTDELNIRDNGRPMTRLTGTLHFSCPSAGLEGDLKFDGCMPSSDFGTVTAGRPDSGGWN